LYGVLVRFSTRVVQKHHLNLFGGSPCQKLFTKKVRGKNSVVFFPSISLIAVLAVPLHEELKNTMKIRPENLQKNSKKIGR
jgi:hypothetical protein